MLTTSHCNKCLERSCVPVQDALHLPRKSRKAMKSKTWTQMCGGVGWQLFWLLNLVGASWASSSTDRILPSGSAPALGKGKSLHQAQCAA